ncbi:MAG TPA: Gfo/Idh/MocA family oxidoreductase [Candidatus Saccharimonadales bacterium]|nr:Gfo/Idh/MocA family oxidoreductase [Candidatus Saccharimonadales bacterium]
MSIGIGVVGSGFMGRTWSEVSARHARGTHLVAVTGGRRAPQLAQDYGVALEPSLEALLARPDVHAVVLATPPDGHGDQTVAAAEAGKHLLVEKPMANTVAECQRMVDAADAANVRLALVSQHRWRDAPVAAKRAIDEGRVGDIRMVRVQSTATGWWDLEARQDQWKKDPQRQSAFASDAAHGCDIARWYMNLPNPVRAFSQFRSYSGFVPGESSMSVFAMDNDVLVEYWMTYELPEPGLGSMSLFVAGSKAMLQVDVYGKVEISRPEGGWDVIFEQGPFDPLNAVDPARLRAYAGQMEDLVAAIAERRDPFVSGRQGVITTQMLEGAERSAHTNKAVELPL